MKLLHWSKIFNTRHRSIYVLRIMLVSLLIAVGSLSLFGGAVFAAPTITTTSLPDGQVGTYYSVILTAAPISGSYSWALTSGTLPPGLTLLPTTGLIYGTPTTAGTYSFAVTITDTTGASLPQSLYITIDPAFNITTSTLPDGKEGTAYSTTLSLSGGTSPYSWTLYTGTLPSGLTLGSTTGTISGTPSANTEGTYSFTVYVADSSASILTTQKAFTLYIEEGAYEATVSIGTGLAAGNTKIKVDGQTVATLEGGESTELTLSIGTAKNVSVDSTVEDPAEQGIRYKAADDTIRVSETQPDAEFDYYTEYQVTVKTVPSFGSQPTGGGWYKEDATANVTANSQVDGNTGTQYRFAYWLANDIKKGDVETLNLAVDSPLTVVANYDTYYRLTAESAYGTVEGTGWYKAGSQARWLIVNDRVPMPGLIGLFQGKFKAVNASGTETMDEPKTVTVFWEPDYTLPYILIPLASLVFVLAMYGIYRTMSGQPSKPQPRTGPPVTEQPPPYIPPAPPYPQYAPPQPMPNPQPHTTVVMIGGTEEKSKSGPQSTKEQLMEKFGELLEKYETEIKTTRDAAELPPPQIIPQKNRIAPPPPVPPPAIDAEYSTREDDQELCPYNTKKLLRTVTSKWKQLESSSVTLPPSGEGEAKESKGVLIVWAKYIFNEWEIHTCTLMPGHQGKHQGKTEVVYSLLNIIIEKKIYGPADKELQPPSPHYTDNMPELEISDDQIVSTDDLPLQTEK